MQQSRGWQGWRKKWAAALCVLALLLGCLPALAQDIVREPKALLDGILSYEMKQEGAESLEQLAQEALPLLAGSGGEWLALALHQAYPELDLSAYADALADYAENSRITAAASRQRVALLLIACGRAEHPFVGQTAQDSIGQQGVMSWIFGLHLLQNGVTEAACSREQALEALLALQLPDGGFAVRGAQGDADVTAMALQALSAEQETEAAAQAVEQALAFLSAAQLPSGGFASYGTENAESTAQAIIALTGLGIDPETDARFIKDGHSALDALGAFALADGSFSHEQGGESNAMATVQALCALVSWERFARGDGSLYQLEPYSVPAKTALSGQYIATIAIGALGILVCVLLWLLKKRHYKNYLLVLAVCAGLLATVWVLDVQTPETYYASTVVKQDLIGQVTLEIRCDRVAGEAHDPALPESGTLLAETVFPLAEGETVYDILIQAAQQAGLLLDCRGTAGNGRLAYVAGIQGLYEFDFGDLSGWVYHVNGQSPDVGCGAYVLADGDRIQWLYSRELGNDVK